VATAFYTVATPSRFLGVVALLNSLRLVGHDEPFRVADCGLEPWQRDALEGRAELVPTATGTSACLRKCSLPRAAPADMMVLLDTDVIVTRRLDPLLVCAAEGAVVAFADPAAGRFHPEWSELLDLPRGRPLRYLNTGLVILPRRRLDLLDKVERALHAVDLSRSALNGERSSNPFSYADQDVWNAVLAAATAPEEVLVLPQRLAPHPPFAGLALESAQELHCRYEDGTRPFLLHDVARKPSAPSTPAALYSHLLLGPDVAVPVPPERVPFRFHARLLPALERRLAAGR
jgi:hypothetical protein